MGIKSIIGKKRAVMKKMSDRRDLRRIKKDERRLGTLRKRLAKMQKKADKGKSK